jgi:hypothetical protein
VIDCVPSINSFNLLNRERTPQFVVPAYLSGPKNVNHQETGPLWLKFEQALSNYEDIKRYFLLICAYSSGEISIFLYN